MSLANIKKISIPNAKDPNGDPVLLCVDDTGRLIVTESDPGICFQTPEGCEDLTATVPGTADAVTIGEIAIADTKSFKGLGWSVSSNVDTIWTLCRVDDAAGTPVETVLHRFLTTPSQPHSCCKLECKDFNTITFTGNQLFRLKAKAVDADCLGPALGFAYTREV